MKTSLKISGIDVCYDSSPVLADISFQVERGEFLGIIGPNGCGKTTLLRALSRVLKPSAGAVLLDETDIFSISSRRFAKELAVVPQDTSAAFDFTVLEVVLMGRSPHLARFEVEGQGDAEIARQALVQTQTLHLQHRSVGTLSGGELQRVIIARGLAQQPQILLLDEPTSHLDLSYQFEILDLVQELNRRKSLTVLAVLHDLNLAAHYCHRLVLLGEGKIQAIGPPEEVITAENVRKVYGAEIWVRRHPTSGRPYVVAGVGRSAVSNERVTGGRRIHIVCGGGTGAPIMAKMFRRGYEVSAGVLNVGDTDLEVAESLGMTCSTCPPFTAVSDESEELNLRLIEAADAVVLSDLPFGQWNLPNASAVRRALDMGKPVFLLRPDAMGSRDFTDGRASQMVDEMVAAGALSVQSLDELAAQIEKTLC